METYAAKPGDSIKIHVTPNPEDNFGGESMWAEELGNFHARIKNLPFFCLDKLGYDDTVRYVIEDGIREFKEVIVSRTTSWGVTWEPTDSSDRDKVSEEWQTIAKHLKSNDVHYESATAGMFVIALPVDKSDEENITWLKALKYSSPIALTLYIGDDEEEGE